MRVRFLSCAALMLVPAAAWSQGNPVGPEFRVNTYTTGGQRTPAVALDDAGNFVVVWRGPQPGVPGSYAVLGQRYQNSGAPLGPEFLVATYTTSPPTVQGHFPQVASDPSGNFVVVWETLGIDDAFLGVAGQRYASSGVPLGTTFRVNSYTPFDQYDPVVAADGSGNFVVVWQSDLGLGSGVAVSGQRYASSGAPMGPEFSVNTIPPAFSQPRPAVAANGAGDFVVVWRRSGSIYGQRYASSGAPLGTNFTVTATGLPTDPAVASNAQGDFVVVWETYYQDGSYAGVAGRRYASSGAPLGSEFRVNTYTTSSQLQPSIIADASGNFVVVWSGSGAGDTTGGVFGQRFGSSGAPLGTEFRINTYVTSSQQAPSVAANSLGAFVVTWRSNAQDGSSYGIYGQRYNMILPVELMHFRVE
jgi:hypothetical protein